MRFLVLFEELGVSVWAPYDRDATIHLGKNGNDLQATKGLGLGV